VVAAIATTITVLLAVAVVALVRTPRDAGPTEEPTDPTVAADAPGEPVPAQSAG
jgi:hypothetical protein